MSNHKLSASEGDGSTLPREGQEAPKEAPSKFRLTMKGLELMGVILNVINGIKELLFG